MNWNNKWTGGKEDHAVQNGEKKDSSQA